MCQLPTGVIASSNAFLSMVGTAIAGAILFYALIRLLNLLLTSQRLSIWLELEMADIINTLLLLIFFSSSIAFLASPASSQLVDSLISLAYGERPSQLLSAFGGVYNPDVCLYENTYNLLTLIMAELVKVREAGIWGASIYNAANQQVLSKAGSPASGDILPIPIPLGPYAGLSLSYRPYGDAQLYMSALSSSSLEAAMAFVMFNILAFLLMVGPLGFYFVTIGFVMRALPGLKPIGSSLAAIGIAFTIFFPLLLTGEAIAMLAYQQPFSFSTVSDEPQLIEEFTTSPEEILGAGTISAMEAGLMGYAVPFSVEEDGNLTLKRFPNQEVTLFRFQAYNEATSRLAIYGSLVAPINFLLIIVMISSLMAFLGERDSILDFFLINYR